MDQCLLVFCSLLQHQDAFMHLSVKITIIGAHCFQMGSSSPRIGSEEVAVCPGEAQRTYVCFTKGEEGWIPRAILWKAILSSLSGPG